MRSIAAEYGFDLTNFCECYQDYGIDPSQDFLDPGHFNKTGMPKYARALGYSKLSAPDVTDAKTHLADVEGARAKYAQVHTARASSVDYIKASNAINQAQAHNNLISAIGSFGQSFIQSLSQFQQAEATKMGAEQKKAEEELDQTRDLFNQAEELVNNIVQLMNSVRQAEMQSMRDAIQA